MPARISATTSLAAGLCLAAMACSGVAQACTVEPRTITLAPGQNIGGNAPGFQPSMLNDREVVLTFDDGPNSEITPRILDILKAACAPATFFVLGGPAEEHPALVRRELAEGHAVGGHTASHVDLSGWPLDEAVNDIAQGFQPVVAAGGKPTLFRFPQLKSTPQLLEWLQGKGMAAVGADIDPWDWAGDPPHETLARLKQQLGEKGRGIILMHDNQPNTAKLLPDLLAFLRLEGYSIVRLDGPPGNRQLAGG